MYAVCRLYLVYHVCEDTCLQVQIHTLLVCWKPEVLIYNISQSLSNVHAEAVFLDELRNH